MTITRPAAVAGAFYPSEPGPLAAIVDRFLAGVSSAPRDPPKALIVPHAGFIYSGSVAASAYATLRGRADIVERVVLLGPSHRVALAGLAASPATAFATPLGEVRVAVDALASVAHLPQVGFSEAPHQLEHSLEVQLPFLQRILTDFELAPFAVGDACDEDVAEVLDLLWGGDETLIVVSSDLSHYHDYASARALDAATSRAIVSGDVGALDYDSACGRVPVRGLLVSARRHGLRCELLDLRNSGDTAGDRDRVVGYGAYAFA